MKNLLLYSLIVGFCIFFSSCKKDEPEPETITHVSDADGNVYKVIYINNQIWMAENLKTTKYSNGDPILYVTDNTAWKNDSIGAYCWYNNNVSFQAHGALYNWNAINADVNQGHNICPNGWHVPNRHEFNTMIDSIGYVETIGSLLKSKTKWASPNTGATDAYNFAAIPTGYRNQNGVFSSMDSIACYWSSTENVQHKAPYIRILSYDSEAFKEQQMRRNYGYAVRCIKD